MGTARNTRCGLPKSSACRAGGSCDNARAWLCPAGPQETESRREAGRTSSPLSPPHCTLNLQGPRSVDSRPDYSHFTERKPRLREGLLSQNTQLVAGRTGVRTQVGKSLLSVKGGSEQGGSLAEESSARFRKQRSL